MEDYADASSAANSYAERAIYDEILANLDGYASDASDMPLNQQFFGDIKPQLCDEDEDPRLRYVMNDHNYMLSNRHTCMSSNMRQNLIEFIRRNSESTCTSSSEVALEKLVDNVLKLLSRATNYEAIIVKMEEAFEKDQVDSIKIESGLSENQLKDDFSTESDQYSAEEALKAELNLLLDVMDPDAVQSSKECEEKPLLEQIDTPMELVNESSTIKVESKPEEVPLEENRTEQEELAKTLDAKDVPIDDIQQQNEPKEASKIPSSDSAEPEQTTETEEKNKPDENVTETPEVINKLILFAEKLKDDYTSASATSDFSLESFLSLKTREYKAITSSILYVDTSVQTEKVISKKKLRKINAQDKRLLLESSNDSESSASSYVDKSLTELETGYSSRKPYFSEFPSRTPSNDVIHKKKSKSQYFTSDTDSDDECAKSVLSQFNESLGSLSKDENCTMDQSDPSKDSEKDKNKPKLSSTSAQEENSNKVNDKQDQNYHEKIRGKGTNESDKENRSLGVSSEHSTTMKSTDEGSHDKEIERLLNLKGLADPQKNTSLTNNSKTHKSTGKFSSKNDSLYAVIQEIDRNSLSDDSQNEDSEQILTEKQFLVKCNENLKQQLLNSASSESDNCNSDIDLDLINKSNEHSGDEDENRLSYVDKFLETLIDTEDNSPATSEAPKIASPSRSPELTTDTITTKTISPPSNSTTDRDAFGLKRKEKPQKTFVGPLSSDKKQKVTIHEDLIDLSADSCNSDVEEFPIEQKEKSQRIKPMLRQDQLESETIYAQKKEAERLRRLEKRNTFLTKMLKVQSENVNEKDLVLDYTTVNKKFIKVHPEIVKHLKPHQRDGVKFMYDSCYGCVDDLKENSGSGCILAHCMGLGKTLQIIALLHTVTTYKELKTSKILVLCPKSTIMNWADEIQRWLGPLDVKSLQIFNFSDTADIFEKISTLRQWSSPSVKAGCLIMGYEAFRSLVFYHSHKGRAKSTVKIEDIRKNINKYLLNPGADLVVCDEGHIIKNRKSGISLAAAEIVTPKRIILTGTPIQNNLKEYYSMVNFIKPLILGTEKEFANLYANPIKNGQHKDSSKRDIKVMKQRSFVLHKKLSKCVQRKEAELLQSFLPQKFEYVLFIPMTDVQNNLYEYVLEAISKREDSRGRSLITDYTCLRKIWTHPKVLEDAWKNAIAAKNKKEPRRNIAHSDDDQPDDIYDNQTGVISVQRDWWRSLVTETDLESILPSNKLKTMFEIIRMSEENAFVAVLNVVEYFFNKINDKQRNFFMFDMPEKTPTAGRWINGHDYYRLDGKTNKTIRHEMVKRFNDPKNKRARVFLISAKAGGQGINLIGANRVIILDTSWNPANDQQNIFRIFRLGQKKNCYVYRLIAMGTMEEKVYSRSVTKQAMSFRVVDEQQIDRHYNMAELAELYTLTKPCYNERPVPIFPQDQILANLLLNFPDLVYKYHEHDSLLENKVEQELSEQEKADAWVAYERDLQMNTESRDVMEGFHGYPLFGQGPYMGPMGDFDGKSLLQGGFDLTQMDLASRTALGSSLIPNYMVNRNSYLDILNMYKNFSSSLLNDKSNRNSRYNHNYSMPLAPGMMNNPANFSALSGSESHLSALNPFYSLHSLASTNSGFPSSSLNSNAMMSHPSLPVQSQANLERYEQNKNMMSGNENGASSMRNYTPSMASFPKDLSLPPKNRLQNPSPSDPSSSPILHSPTHQLPQNMFSTSIGADGIPRSVIPKRRGKTTNKTTPLPSVIAPEAGAKTKLKDSNLETPSPRQNISGIQDISTKLFDQSAIQMPVNMGIVYPKQMSSAASESNEGSRTLKTGNGMQIIPTHSPLSENVRKKFDNISPNISLTAVRTVPKPLQPEQLQSASSHLDVSPSNSRKRRSSFGSSFLPGNDNEKNTGKPPNTGTSSAMEQPNIPPKVSKY